MITALRTALKGPVLRVIMAGVVVILVGSMFLPKILDNLFQKQTGDWVFQVNNLRITPMQYQRIVAEQKLQQQQMMRQWTEQYGAEMAQQLSKMSGMGAQLEKQARHSALTTEALAQIATKLGIDVPEEEVMDQIMQQLPAGIVDEYGNVNLQALQQLIPYASLEDFSDDMKVRMQNSMVINLIDAGIYMPKFMVKDLYVQQFAKKNYGVAFFPISKYLADVKKAGATDKELKEYFAKENKQSKRYWIPEKRSVVVWEFDPKAHGLSVTPAQVERYYSSHKLQEFIESPTQMRVRRILLPFDEKNPGKSRAEANKLYEELKKDPSQFVFKASNNSIDKESAKNGGLLDWAKRGDMHEKLEKEIFALKADNDMTPVLHSPDGLEFYQRVAKKAQSYKAFKTVEGEIRDKLLAEKFNKSFTAAQRRVINQYRDGNKAALEDFIKAKGGKKDAKVFSVTDSDTAAKKAFEMKRASALTSYQNDGKGYIEQLLNIEKSKEPSFDSVKAKVQQDFYQQKAHEAMKKAMDKVEASVKNQPLSKAVASMGLQYKTTGWVNRDDKAKIEALQKDKFPVGTLMNIVQKGKIRKDTTADMGYLSVLLDVEPLKKAQNKEKELELAQSLRQQQETILKQAFIASLLQNATIKVNNKLINR
ncbi:MAG TPA: peptidylprolyl isomerase [Candidatus Babeliales bacterium]|nr:peptidylprolyl isomerase [Candidatus Babeliales bacterium]